MLVSCGCVGVQILTGGVGEILNVHKDEGLSLKSSQLYLDSVHSQMGNSVMM